MICILFDSTATQTSHITHPIHILNYFAYIITFIIFSKNIIVICRIHQNKLSQNGMLSALFRILQRENNIFLGLESRFLFSTRRVSGYSIYIIIYLVMKEDKVAEGDKGAEVVSPAKKKSSLSM